MAQHKTQHLQSPQSQTHTSNATLDASSTTSDSRRAPPNKITRQNAIATSDEPCVNLKKPPVMHQLSLPNEQLGCNKEAICASVVTVLPCENLKGGKSLNKKQMSSVESTSKLITDISIVVPSSKPIHNAQLKVPKTGAERCKTASVKLSSKPILTSTCAPESTSSNEKTKVTKRKKASKSGHGSERKVRLRRAVSAVEAPTHTKSKKHKYTRQESVPSATSSKKTNNRRSLQKQMSLPVPSCGKLFPGSRSHMQRNDTQKLNVAHQLSIAGATTSKVHHPNKKETSLSTETTGILGVADRQKKRSTSAVSNAAHDNSKSSSASNLIADCGIEITKLTRRSSSAVPNPANAHLSRQDSVPSNSSRSNLRFLKQASLPSEPVGYLPDGGKKSNLRTVLSPMTNSLYRPDKERKSVNFSDAIAFPEVATVISEVSPVASDVENTDTGASWTVQAVGRTKSRSTNHAPAFLNRTYHTRSRPNSSKVQDKPSTQKVEDTSKKHGMPRISSATKRLESVSQKITKGATVPSLETSTSKKSPPPSLDAVIKVDSAPQKMSDKGKTETLTKLPIEQPKERKVLGVTSATTKNETVKQNKLLRANTAPEVPAQEENRPPTSPIIHHLGTETECLELHKKLITNGLEVPLGKIKRALMTPTEFRLLHARGINSAKH